MATEAGRSIATGTSRALLLAATTAVLFGALAWWEVSTVAATQRDARAYVAAGASTYVLNAPGLIDPTACDQLADVAGITAAGALARTAPDLIPIATPQRTLPLFAITPGMATLLGAPSGGMIATDVLAAQYGLHTRPILATATGDYPVIGAFPYPDDGRDPTLGYAVLAPGGSSSRYDQCWARVDPPDQGKQTLLYTAIASATGPDTHVTIGQLNPRLGTTSSTAADFRSRTSRWAPVIAALAGALLTLAILRLRRLELATARHLGVTRSELLAQTTLETLAWAVPTTLFTLGALTVYTAAAHIDTAVWTFGALTLAAGLAGTIAGAITAAATIHANQIIQYFKARN